VLGQSPGLGSIGFAECSMRGPNFGEEPADLSVHGWKCIAAIVGVESCGGLLI
jgi:hypothetical protein